MPTTDITEQYVKIQPKLTYRINKYNPPIPSESNVLGQPLSMLQIDGNMKSIETQFEIIDSNFTLTQDKLDKKADLNNPKFTGALRLPVVSDLNQISDPVAGMLVYNMTTGEIASYNGSQWSMFSAKGYVKLSGDSMTGKLFAPGAEFTELSKSVPPDDSPGPNQPHKTDIIATVEWTKRIAAELIDARLTGGSGDGSDINFGHDNVKIESGNLTIENGNIYVNNGYIRGNLDMGVL